MGRWYREYDPVENAVRYEMVRLGRLLLREYAGGGVSPGPDGEWVEGSWVWAQCRNGEYEGVLSEVGNDVIRYGGRPLGLVAYCSGPPQALPCGGGYTMSCMSCSEHSLRAVQGRMSMVGSIGELEEHQFGCQKVCPSEPNPVIERLIAFAQRERLHAYYNDPAIKLPAIYRTRELCNDESEAPSKGPLQ